MLERDGAVEKPGRDWNAHYQRTVELPPPERYNHFLEQVPQGGAVLDFGCGSGRFACAFHRDRPDLQIDVLDAHLDAAPLLKDADWIRQKLHTDFRDFSSPAHYDAIWSWATLFFLQRDEMSHVVEKLSEALKAGGHMKCTFVAPSEAGNAMNFTGLEESDIHDMLRQAGLEIVSLEQKVLPYGRSKSPIPTFLVHARKT